jgi:hypothetical protein
MVALAAWLGVIWFLEAWLPFYDEFRSARDKLRHDGRNIAIGAAGGLISAVFMAAVIPRVAGCDAWGFGLL